VLRRVVGFEDFSVCYPNDSLVAAGLVAKVRSLVNVKDSFTRMQIEEQRQRTERLNERKATIEKETKRLAELESLKKQFFALFSESNPSRRGKLLEPVLNNLFQSHNILIKEAFSVSGNNAEGIVEQIDGVIKFEGQYYLVEMKWKKEPLGVPEVSEHMVRVYHRGQSRGLFISASGYTDPAVSTCRDGLKKSVFVLFDLQEIVMLLERGDCFIDLLRKKIDAAFTHKNPFYQPPI